MGDGDIVGPLGDDVKKSTPMTKHVFYLGIILGIILLCAGVALHVWRVDRQFSVILMSCGLGLILSAFGGSAVYKGRGWVIGGVLAVSLVVGMGAIYLQKQFDKLSDNRYAELKIKGVGKHLEISMAGEQEIASRKIGGRRGHIASFIILKAELDRVGQFDFTIGDQEFNCVNLKNTLTSRIEGNYTEAVEWNYNPQTQQLIDHQRNIISRHSCMPDGYEEAGPAANLLGFIQDMPSFISYAYAGGANPNDFNEIIDDLNSRSSMTRRVARQDLQSLVSLKLKNIIAHLNSENATEKEMMGILLALTDYNRTNKNKSSFAKNFDQKSLMNILTYVGSKNTSLRHYATKFLQSLSDQRVLTLALKEILQDNKLGAYNRLTLIRDFKQSKIGKNLKATLKADLANLKFADERVDVFRQDVILLLEKGAKQISYILVAGSFENKANAEQYKAKLEKQTSNRVRVGRDTIHGQYPVFVGKALSWSRAVKSKKKILQNKAINENAYLKKIPY